MAFEAINVVCAGAGSALLYSTWGRDKLSAYLFSDFLDKFPMDDRLRASIELVVFVGFGTFIALVVTTPNTPGQAFSAGMGWTGFAARPKSSTKKRSKP